MKRIFSFFLVAIFFSCSEESITKSSNLNIEFTFKNSWTTFDGNPTNYVPRSELLPDLNLNIFDDNNNLVKTLLISQKANGNYISVSTKLEYGSYTFVLDDNLTSDDENEIGFSHELIIRESSANIIIESEVQTIKLVVDPAVWLLNVRWASPDYPSALKFSLIDDWDIDSGDTLTWHENLIDLEKCRVNGEKDSEYFIFMNYHAKNISYYLVIKGTIPNTTSGSVLTKSSSGPRVPYYYPTNAYIPQKHLTIRP